MTLDNLFAILHKTSGSNIGFHHWNSTTQGVSWGDLGKQAINSLYSIIDCSSPAGSYGPGCHGCSPIDIWYCGADNIWRYNPSAGWTNVLNPSNSEHWNAVWAISPNDVWVGGTYKQNPSDAYYNKAFVRHWNGSAWESKIALPVSGSGSGDRNIVNSLWASGSNDVWAAGTIFRDYTTDSGRIWHYNGTSWTTFYTTTNATSFGKILGFSPTSLWALGKTWQYGAYADQCGAWYYNGSNWTFYKALDEYSPFSGAVGTSKNNSYFCKSREIYYYNGTWHLAETVPPSNDHLIGSSGHFTYDSTKMFFGGKYSRTPAIWRYTGPSYTDWALVRVTTDFASYPNESVYTLFGCDLDPDPPYLANEDPSPESIQLPSTNVLFDILDNYAGVSLTTVDVDFNATPVIVNGVFQTGYSGTITAITHGYRYNINPSSNFTVETVSVDVYAEDRVGNSLDTSYDFYVDLDPPFLANQDPAPLSTVSQNVNVLFDILDILSGVDPDTVDITFNAVPVITDGVFQTGYSGTITAITHGYHYDINPDDNFTDDIIYVHVYAEDIAGQALDTSYDFYIDLGTDPPYLANEDPAPLSVVAKNVNVLFDILDDSGGVDPDTVDITFNTAPVITDGVFQIGYSGTITAITHGYRYNINPDDNFTDDIIYVHVYAEDLTGNVLDTEYYFNVDLVPPFLDNQDPPHKGLLIPSSNVKFDILDLLLGVASVTVDITFNGDPVIADGVFQPGYTGTITPVSLGYHYDINPDNDFTVRSVIVHVYAEDLAGNVLDTSYGFSVDVIPPYLDNEDPAPLSTAQPTTNVIFDLLDIDDMVVAAKTTIEFNGDPVITDGVFQPGYTGTITPVPLGYHYDINPDNDFMVDVVTVRVYAEDLAGNVLDVSYDIYIDLGSPYILPVYPEDNDTDVDKDISATFIITDNDYQIKENTIKVWARGELIFTNKSFVSGWDGSSYSNDANGFDFILSPGSSSRWVAGEVVKIRCYGTNIYNIIADRTWSFTINDPFLKIYPFIFDGVRNVDEVISQ